MYEELKSLSLNSQAFFASDSFDNSRNLFLPAFFRDVNSIEGLIVCIFFGPFPKPPNPIDSSRAEEKIDTLRQLVLENLEQILDTRDSAFCFAGAVGAKKISGL